MISWLGNVLIVIGLYGIGNKWRPSFLFSIAGETCWMIWSYQQSNWALMSICAIFNMMALRNYVKWGQE